MILDYLRKAMGYHRLYFGGGSGGNSSTQEFKPPSWTTSYGQAGQGPWQDYLNRAIGLSNEGYEAYPGQVIAGPSTEQQWAADMGVQRATQGAPDLNAARGQATDTSNGLYLNNNPWTSSGSTLGQTAQGGALNSNPWLQNDYTAEVINQNTNNMANAYRIGTGAQTDAAFARGGAFGGSAYNQMVGSNNAGLANSVGQMANTLQLQRMGMGAQDYQQERGLQQGAALAGLGAYQGERGNMMQAAQMAPGLAADDWQSVQALMGIGDANRQYQQDLFNQGLSQWNAGQNYDRSNLDLIGNALARSSGNAAGGNSQVSQGNYQASPWASLLGLGAAGYGLYSGMK